MASAKPKSQTEPKPKSDEGKKKSSKKVVTGILAVIVLAGGIGSYFLLAKPAAAKGAVLAPVSYNVGPIVTNLDDGHVIQEQMTMMVSGLASAAPLDAQRARVTNMVIQTLSGWSYNGLLTANGKQQLRHQIETQMDALLAGMGHKPTVTALYFTNFIMQ